MPDERCPWCGAERRGAVSWKCYTLVSGEEWQRTTSCRVLEAMNLRARVTRLETVLRTILAKWPSGTATGDLIQEALSDTHGPGTIAGDAAREGLNP